MKPIEDLLADVRMVVVCTPDNCSRLIGKKRPIGDWPKLCSEGLAVPDFHLVTGIENRPLPYLSVSGAAKGFRNGILMPDPEAAFLSPTEPETVLVLADTVTARGEPVEEAPRRILKRQIERLAAHNVVPLTASELEFYAFAQSYAEANKAGYQSLVPIYHRHGDNDVLVAGFASAFSARIVQELARSGIEVDQVQGEGGTGQLEVNVRPAPPLVSADNHVVFKHVVKSTGYATGHAVTFLAKPFEDEAGSGGHVHLSLATHDGRSAIGTEEGLSDFGQAFIAGILALTPELTLLHAHYANSYRRLVPGAFTPLRSSWGWDNRTAMLRLIGRGSSLRIEFRLPGADVNPYLSYAALLAAGLAGVESCLQLPPSKASDVDPPDAAIIPGDLTEALLRFEQSGAAKAAFGERIHAHLSALGRHELRATRKAVTSWDVRRGFETA